MRYFKYFTLLIILSLISISCAGYKNLKENDPWDYSEFRNNQQFFSSNDGTLAYTDKGKGDVIVLLHGVPSSSWLYREMIDGLVNSGYRVIIPDMLGFGNSDNPDGYDVYSNKNHASRLLALMNALQIENWTQVVHDAGGVWTWELLKLDDSKITNLVMLNTILYDEGFNPPIRMKKGIFPKLGMWLYRNGLTADIMLGNFMNRALKDRKTLTKAEYDGYKTPIREGKTKGMYYFFTSIRKPFPQFETTLEAIKVPKLIIWGAQDKMLKLNTQEQQIISKMNVSPENIHKLNASHFLQEERAEKINQLIIDFLK